MEIIKRQQEYDFSAEVMKMDSGAAQDALIQSLLTHSEDEIEAVIPQDSSIEVLDRYMDVAVGAYGKMNNASFKLKPILARIIAIIASRPDMMEMLGAKDVTRLCRDILPNKYHISNTECFRLLALGRQWPDITVNKYNTVGPARLRAISRAVPMPQDGRLPEREKAKRERLLEIAPTMRIDRFYKYLEDEGYADKDSLAILHVTVPVDTAQHKRWRDFVQDKDVIEFVGSNRMSTILDAMVAECTVAWKAEIIAKRSQ